MIAEIKAVSALIIGLAITTASRFLLPSSTHIPTIPAGMFWPASIVTTLLIVRKFAAGNPLPASILQANLSKKTIVVTGSSSGLGYQSALFFAIRGATVILGNRSVARNEETAKRLRAEPEAQGKQLDLVTRFAYDAEDLKCVKKFATDLKEYFSSSSNTTASPRLDCLLANAGMLDWNNVGFTSKQPDIDYTACINSFAPLLLTEVLMDTMKRCNTRVVIVASSAHRRITAEKYSPQKIVELFKWFWQDAESRSFVGGMLTNWERYALSKLFNIFHADYLASRGVEVATLHPGVCSTNFASGFGKAIEFLFQYVGPWVGTKTEYEGAVTQIFCALIIPAPPVTLVNDRNKYVTHKASYFCDSVIANSQHTAHAKNTDLAESIIGFALERLQGI